MDFDAHMLQARLPDHATAQGLICQIRIECQAMACHTLQQGLAIAPELVARLATLLQSGSESECDGAGEMADESVLLELAEIHGQLTCVVAPATPQGIVLLDPQRARQRYAWLGPVPLIRMLTIAAIVFLVAMMLTGLSTDVSNKNMALGPLESSGTVLLLNLLFLLFCAGLGASFSALFRAHRYIANSSYDPKYDASYCAHLILGVMAGMMLSEMLPDQLLVEHSVANFGKPALAMLGGFSSTAVQHILLRLIETLEALVRGDPSAHHKSELDAYKAQVLTERAHSKTELTGQLLALQQILDTDPDPDLLRQRLAELISSSRPPRTK
jgi:hypothetical protein